MQLCWQLLGVGKCICPFNNLRASFPSPNGLRMYHAFPFDFALPHP